MEALKTGDSFWGMNEVPQWRLYMWRKYMSDAGGKGAGYTKEKHALYFKDQRGVCLIT